jgi:hypothetical protein
MQIFHQTHKEKPEYNQYWYSVRSIEAIVGEVKGFAPMRVACLSTPSVFAYCETAGIPCDLFDFDRELIESIVKAHPSCHAWEYDFNEPDIPSTLRHEFDFVICDPPFVSSEVIENYSRTIHQLLVPEGRIIFTSIAENLPVLRQQLGSSIEPATFLPSIPGLTYQYNIFVNYLVNQNSTLAQKNTEVH